MPEIGELKDDSSEFLLGDVLVHRSDEAGGGRGLSPET